MKSVLKTTAAALENIKAALPEYLEKNGAAPFETSGLGYPPDPEKTALYVRFSEGGETAADERFGLIIHAQLPGTAEEGAYRWADAVNGYLRERFSPGDLGYLFFEFTVLMADNPRAAAVDLMWDIALSYKKDDCDG